jgi:hypothetical protein
MLLVDLKALAATNGNPSIASPVNLLAPEFGI